MSKTIRRVISSLLVVAAFSTIEPTNYINLINQRAYAATFSSSENALLDDIDTDEGNISFSSTRSTATGTVKSSVDEVEITADAKESSYKITIDGDTTGTGKCSKTIDLDNGRNTIKIKVEDPSGDKTTVTYYVYITKGSSSRSSDDDDDDDVYLDNITISGQSFSFSRKQNSYNIEVSESVDEIRIKAEPEDEDDTVEIDGSTVDEDDNYRKWVSLDKGKNVIKITVEDEDDDNDRTYTLNVYRGEKAPTTTSEVGKIDETQDSIYLDDLIIYDAGSSINFKPKVTGYELNVKEDCDSVIVKAEPDDDDDIVRVNDDTVGSNYSKRVYLQNGKNVIKVKVNNDYDTDDDDYEQRIYTITINRGTVSGSTSNTTTNGNSNANPSVKANGWVKNAYGQWSYNDALGKPLTNAWFYDRNYGKWYYLRNDGSMATGWKFENGKGYYLNDDGSMQIGWKYIGNFWHYFDADGSMKTGWFKSSDGKWYYFYPGGGMASNVRIDGYKLGADGAMI